jgi:hypothetical protein
MPPFLADLHPLDRAPDSAADRALDAAHLRTAEPDVIDMLTALLKLAEPVYTTRRDDGSEIAHPTILAARAAIAKATGSDK